VIADSVNAALRKGILWASESATLRSVVRTHGMRFGASRFVAGETLDQAVPVLRGLNAEGLLTNTTVLGEGVKEESETRHVVDAYRGVVDRIAVESLQTNVAIKPTHLGLSLSEELAFRNIADICAHARDSSNFIRMDMEESRHVDATLDIYRRLRDAGIDNVGFVLQAYLYRTPSDVERLLPLSPNLRLCKGAYLEPASIAHPEKRDVDRAYAQLLERCLREAAFTAIATHDERMIEHAIGLVSAHSIPAERFQFQMLYGVRPQLQRALVRRGFSVLVATPYGPDWYRYLMRRLAERPANVGFLLRNLVRG
jgi:proline dehydrogenase